MGEGGSELQCGADGLEQHSSREDQEGMCIGWGRIQNCIAGLGGENL